jgi:predicted transcriptional regulator
MKNIHKEEPKQDKLCTGCGRLLSQTLGKNKLGEDFLACCPDSNYVEKQEIEKDKTEKKQTAVEWLAEQFQKIVFYSEEAKEHTIKQAKEMEKQQGYSEEEVLNQLNILMSLPSSTLDRFIDENGNITMKWFELFKNK